MESILDHYTSKGWVGPLPVLTPDEVAHYGDLLLETDDALRLMQSDFRCKSNVLFPWVDEITRNPYLVSYIRQIIGPDFHCWDTLFWIKKPWDGRDVSFHQDATYWNFDNKHRAVTAWLAFNDVTEEQGPVEYVDGSHRELQQQHLDIKTSSNLLQRGQTVDVPISETTWTPMAAGSVMLHSPYVIHGSRPNRSTRLLAACGMVFVSTECRPLLNNAPESTVMISGSDRFGHMLHDPRPTDDWKRNYKHWKQALDRQRANDDPDVHPWPLPPAV